MRVKGPLRVKGPPVSVGSFLEQYFKQHGLDSTLQEYKIWTHWEKLVGPKLASKCRPAKLRHHSLTITVATSTWLTQLQMMKSQLMDQIQRSLNVTLNQIYFKVGPITQDLSAPSTQEIPLNTDNMSRVEKIKAGSTQYVTDTELRDIIERVVTKNVTLSKE